MLEVIILKEIQGCCDTTVYYIKLMEHVPLELNKLDR